jgi:hypothetical protein
VSNRLDVRGLLSPGCYRELDPQPVAFKRASTDAAGMRETIDGTFGALFGQLGQLGVTPTDVPYIRYLKTGEELGIELGVPVAANGTSLGGLEQASLPGGRAAGLRYVGPYDARLAEASAWLDSYRLSWRLCASTTRPSRTCGSSGPRKRASSRGGGRMASRSRSAVEFRRAGTRVQMTLRFDHMHDELWTERARAGHESELARFALVLQSRNS